jgi:hypothetical protein
VELTTFWGHALVLGLEDWTDWRVHPGIRSMEDIQQEVAERGGLFVIAHPLATGDPYCTGCAWSYTSMMPGTARAVEVWNGDWLTESNNSLGLAEAYRWLNIGSKLTFTSGTDNHDVPPAWAHQGFNHVFAQEFSVQGILEAVRAGHVLISSGPVLLLTAAANSVTGMMGDVLDAGSGPITLDIRWQDCPSGARLELIVDGSAFKNLAVSGEGSIAWIVEGGSAHWVLATLSIAGGKMLAITNPIFFDGRR